MASEDSFKAKVAPRPRKPAAAKPVVQNRSEEAVTGIPAVAEAAVEQLVPSPAQPAETIEAVPSPVTMSDAIPAPSIETVDPAPAREEVIDMATIAPNEVTDKAQAAFGEFSNRFKTAFEKSTKLNEDLVDFAKGNVEAVIASARVAAKAGELLGQEAADYGKKNFESATAALKSFATVKSPTELFQLQSEFAKAQFDHAVAEASRLSESLLKVAGEIAQPLSNRYALAAEKIRSTSL